MNYPACNGACRQGHAACNCDPYANEPSPRLVRWLDENPGLASVAAVFFILLVLGIGGAIDHGGVL